MAVVPFDPELAARLRECLAPLDVREVAMFGGRSFMVHEQLCVAAASDGTMLVRCAPDELDRLLRREGARPAEMRGRPMSPGWIRIDLAAVDDDADLARWVNDAVAYAARRAS
ncbi:MAG TPA: TfoX/Sxy family protein [Ilumatobacteraceae bacterium]|nr:TfoX/Sxy family protein [Ilumatobacteraceae bacterium]